MEAAAASANGDRPSRRPFAADRDAHVRVARTPTDGGRCDDAADDDADDVVADTVVNANGGLFGQIEANDDRVGWSRHALAVAAVAAVMIGAVIAFWTIGRLMEPAADRPGRSRRARRECAVRTARRRRRWS